MKNLLAAFVLLFLASFSTFANDADLFNCDYDAVQTEFAELDQLCNMVVSNSDLTYSTLKENNASMITGLKLVSDTNSPFASFGEPPLGIPSFLWGCVCGPVGLVIVYLLTEEDKAETKKALWGCITTTVVYTVVYIVYAAAVVSTTGI